MKKLVIPAIVFAVSGIYIQPGIAEVNAAHIFKKKCALCHTLSGKGFAPPFSHMNKDPKVLKATIENGRRSMPQFGKKLSAEEIDAMVTFIRSNQTE